jgi:hypothetical protein
MNDVYIAAAAAAAAAVTRTIVVDFRFWSISVESS